MLYASLGLSVVSATLTYHLINRKNVCAVRASSGVTLLLCLIVYFINPNLAQLFAVIYGASFIGMSLTSRFLLFEVIGASIVFVVITPMISSFSPSIGGVLGFSAFLSLLLFSVGRKLYRQILPVKN